MRYRERVYELHLKRPASEMRIFSRALLRWSSDVHCHIPRPRCGQRFFENADEPVPISALHNIGSAAPGNSVDRDIVSAGACQVHRTGHGELGTHLVSENPDPLCGLWRPSHIWGDMARDDRYVSHEFRKW